MKNISLNHNAILRKILAFFTFTLLFFGFYFSFVQQAEAVWCPITVTAYNNSGGPQGTCTSVISNNPVGDQLFCTAPFGDIAATFNVDCIYEPATTLTVNGTAGDISVDPGDNITLRWTNFPSFPPNQNAADSCTASGSGGWSGAKAIDNIVGEVVAASMTPGDYTYTMTCSNAGGSTAVTRTVTVNAPVNNPPTANAGSDRVITLPVQNSDADGTGSSDPDDGIDTYVWTKTAGPATFTINNGNTATPTFTNLTTAGTYTFQLTVTDVGGLSDTDTMIVTVNATPACINDMSMYIWNGLNWDDFGNPLNWSASSFSSSGYSNVAIGPVIGAPTVLGGDVTGVTAYAAAYPGPANRLACGSAPQCSDGVDNDGDTLDDIDDPGCHTDGNAGNAATYDPNDDDETDVAPVCTTGPVVNLGGFGPAFPEWDTCEYATLGDNALMDREPGSSVSTFSSPCRDYMCIDCMTDTITYKGVGRSYVDVTCGGAPAPAITVSPVDLDFGNTEVGGIPRTETFIVSNTGGGTLNVDANPVITPTHVDVGAGVYQCISANCTSPQSITSATPQTYTVQYAPTAVSNNQTATLTLTGSNFADQPITLTGNGVVPATCVLGAFQALGEATTPACQAALGTDVGFACPGNPTDTVTVASWNAAQGGALGACLLNDNCSAGSPSYSFIDSCAGGPPAPTANFTSGTPVAIDAGNNTTLEWTSTDADPNSCTIEAVVGGATTTTWTSLATDSTISGGLVVSPIVNTSYSIECTNSTGPSPNSPDVNVTINPVVSLCPSGPRNSRLDFNDIGSVRADSFFLRMSVNAPATVSPSETFSVSAWGNCIGDDASGSKSITGQLVGPIEAFGSTGPHQCPPAGGGSLGSLNVTAPATPGTYNREFVVRSNPAEINSSEVSTDPVIWGCFQYTVSAAASPPSVSFDANGEDTVLNVVEGTGVTLNWNVTGSAISCTAGGDWSGNKAVTGASELLVPALSVGNYTYTLYCTNATGDSAIETVDVTVNPLAPTVDVQVSVDGGSTWSDADQTIDISQDVYISWTSNNTSPGDCSGNVNVATGGAVSNPGLDVANPPGGSSLTYRVTCTNATDTDFEEITVTTAAPPNLTIGFVEDATYPSLTPEVDGLGNITGNYTDATVRVIVSETAGVAITDTFAVEIELDLNDDGTPDVTYVVPGGIAGIAASGAIPINHTFSTIIPIAPQSRITARVDTPLASNGVITETIDTVADNSDDLFPLPLGLPPIDMELILDPSDLVRGGGNVDIDYDVNATFSMTCELYGPGLATHTFNPSTDGPTPAAPLTAGPINSKSVYTLSCTELVTGAGQVFTESASVETTGTVEEI